MTTKLTMQPGDCFARALPDEPYFVLLARDQNAAALVDRWASFREGLVSAGRLPRENAASIADARGVAVTMREWRKANDGRWRDQTPEQQADALDAAAAMLADQAKRLRAGGQ